MQIFLFLFFFPFFMICGPLQNISNNYFFLNNLEKNDPLDEGY